MAIEPIPQVPISRIMGLLKVLDEAGGRHDVFRLARDVNFELGEILQVIKAAEMLGFVETPGADVVLTATGVKLLKAKVNARKQLLKEQLKKLPLFRSIVEALERTADRRADQDAFLEIFALHLPAENPESLLKTVIDWGRYAELVGFDPEERELYLDQA